MRNLLIVVAALLAGCLATQAAAQVSSALILLPWDEGVLVQNRNSLDAGYDGETERTKTDVELTRFTSVGRVRPSPEQSRWAVGWTVSHLDIDTSDPLLPERLAQQAVAVGVQLGQWEDWRVGGTIGVGYAGNTPWNDGDAYYGIASLAASKRLDSGAMLSVILDYDGNRGVFPDIPLPGFTYANRYDEQLSYALGFPVNSVTWTPDDKWTVTGRWIVPFAFTVDAEYALTEDVDLFAGYRGESTGYWLQGDDRNRRLFYEQRRVEAGAKWRVLPRGELAGAVGYLFDQSFERGFDSRDVDTVRDLSDEVFFRIGLNFTY